VTVLRPAVVVVADIVSQAVTVFLATMARVVTVFYQHLTDLQLLMQAVVRVDEIAQ
jgi:hypothetical protein